MHSIAFSKHCEWLAVSSDKGTVHIFALGPAVITGSDQPASPDKLAPAGGAAQQQQQQSYQQQQQHNGSSAEGQPGSGRHNPTSMISNLVKVGERGLGRPGQGGATNLEQLQGPQSACRATVLW